MNGHRRFRKRSGRCHRGLNRGWVRCFDQLQQAGLFQQAAEIFFAGDVPGAGLAGEADQGFVFHFEPFQPHDADVFLALFPDLALLQFHACGFRRQPVPLIFVSGRQP